MSDIKDILVAIDIFVIKHPEIRGHKDFCSLLRNLSVETDRLTAELVQARSALNCYPITYIHDLEWKNAKLRVELAELRERTRWIPVTERLPELPNWVIALNNYNEVFPAVFMDGKWYDDVQDELVYSEITHWMPLPEPPDDYVGDSDHEHDDRIL